MALGIWEGARRDQEVGTVKLRMGKGGGKWTWGRGVVPSLWTRGESLVKVASCLKY